VEFLLDYIDNLLPTDVRFKFDSHIAFCPDCQVYIENYSKTAALARAAGAAGLGRAGTGSAGIEPAPTHLVEAILRTLRECPRPTTPDRP
jgi:anti-sigma factor RsiW